MPLFRTSDTTSARTVGFTQLRVAAATWAKKHPTLLWSTALVSLCFVIFLTGTFFYFSRKYSRLIDERITAGSLQASSTIYAAPTLIQKGDAFTREELIARLQRAGYTDQPNNPLGHYRLVGDGIRITTGPQSYYSPHTVLIEFKKGRIASIDSETSGAVAGRYSLEPELITNVLGSDRGKRRPVAYSEYPKYLVQAVVSIEDKRFFDHSGLDILRVAKAAWVDLKEGRMEQGASTLTMQLARSFWLDQDKTWTRKISEALIARELEDRFSKDQIFQLYANEVYLGRSGSFAVHGFGEAARAYFAKDVRELTLAEAAMLAGMIQRPSYYNPFRYPERVKERRNLVLTLMRKNGYLDSQQLAAAQAAPIQVEPAEIESTDAPYFVDLVNRELQDEKYKDWDFANNSYRIYSSLDLDLQRAAVEAVRNSMPKVDRAARRAGGAKVKGKTPEVALVALDPHTGAIKALIGGRHYRKSQLNRALAMRPPGSTFKPFVFAAALSSWQKGSDAITAGTQLMDRETVFTFNNQPYQPANFDHEFRGVVTVRTALIQSLNVPTVLLAEKTGYQNIVDMAVRSGITAPLQATPSLALGSYDIPPVELAEAYTVFANEGVHAQRYWAESIRDGNNRPVYSHTLKQNPVLDKRVAYIVSDMLSDVMRSGTGGSARALGFALPAAGKTGTAHDGWFAGYTNNLLTVVWIGYDDYTELGLEGSKSALLVWADFMKRAHELNRYANPKPPKMPQGIVKVEIDADTGLIADETCRNLRAELFVSGTQPTIHCDGLHDFITMDPLESAAYPRPEGQRSRGIVGRVLSIFR
jgi:penicillin-binding protein 1B